MLTNGYHLHMPTLEISLKLVLGLDLLRLEIMVVSRAAIALITQLFLIASGGDRLVGSHDRLEGK